MTFSDNDLKRLREKLTEDDMSVCMDTKMTYTLLARLEAAEKAIFPYLDLLGILEEFTELEWGQEGPPVNADEFIEKGNKAMEAWRKAAGK